MVQSNNCCYCNLWTTAIILGLLNLASNIFNLVDLIDSKSQIDEIFEEVFKIDTSISSFMIGIFIIGIGANIAQLCEAYMKQHLLLLPRLITCGINIIILFIVVVLEDIFLKGIGSFNFVILIVGILIEGSSGLFLIFHFDSISTRSREDETLVHAVKVL